MITFQSLRRVVYRAPLVLLMLPLAGWALKQKQPTVLDSKSKVHAPFHQSHGPERLDRMTPPPNAAAWARFNERFPGQEIHLNTHSGRIASVAGGIPWIPGAGNALRAKEGTQQPGMPELETIARGFVAENADLFRLPAGADLRLNPEASKPVTESMWSLRFDLYVQGLRLKHSALVFVVKHGNLILWGEDNVGDLPESGIQPRLDGAQAIDMAARHIGGFSIGDLVGKPELLLIPVDHPQGSSYLLAYEVVIVREGEGEYQATIDARSGQVVEFRDIVDYAQIKGAIYPVSNYPGSAVSRTLGFADYNNSLYADASGTFNYAGGTVTSNLDGRYVTVSDACGAIALSASAAPGDLNFGTNTGTNCTTPGIGGAGNTNSSRSCYYHVDQIAQKGRTFYTSNSWLQGNLQANVNINQFCNANYSPAADTINFYRNGTVSGFTCGNTGEIAGIFLHEWGHGMDRNDGNGAQGSGEAMGDIFAMLQTRSSCTGDGFWISSQGCGGSTTFPGASNCDGYGNCCSDCSGIRENDYRKHTTQRIITPANIATACAGFTGTEPCGWEVHCEGQMPAQTVWDLARFDLPARADLGPEESWALGDKLWWESGPTRTVGYTCANKTGAPWNNGCRTTDWYKAFLAADDDNGNLADGTPHASTIFLAFNRHGISCGVAGDAANQDFTTCPSIGSAGTLSGVAGNNSATLNWTTNATNAGAYKIMRNNLGCGFGFTQIATATAPTTTFLDSGAANGTTWYYQIQPIGVNPDCAGAVSNCISVTPVALPEARYQAGSAVQTLDSRDNDDYPDNCETVTVNFTVENSGGSALTNVRVSALTSSSSAVAVTTPMPINFGNLAAGATANGTFQYTLGAGAQKAACAASIPFAMTVAATEMSGTRVGNFTFVAEQDNILTPAVTYSYESNMEGWAASSGTFTRANTYSGAAGTFALVSSANLDGQCDVVRSPLFEPSATTTLTIATHFDIEPRSAGQWYDRANFAAYNPATSTRTLISPSGGRLYNASGANGPACSSLASQAGYGGAFASWADSSGFDLTPFVGQQIQLDAAYGTDVTVNGTGFHFDNVRLTNVYIKGCDAQADSCAACTAPTAANNAAADVSVCADTGVSVTWTVPSAWGDASGTRTIDVLRNGTAIATGLAATATTYTDLTGVNGTSYTYTVRFNNGCGLSFATAGASAADNISVAPTGLTNNTAADVSACADTGVLISWTADPTSWGGTGTRTYDVLRGATVIATGVAYGTTSFTDLTGVNGTSYTYTVRYNNGCQTATTAGAAAADVLGVAPTAANNAAADVSACADSGVSVTWIAPSAWGDSGGARTIDVLRNGTAIATGLAATATAYTDLTGVNGTSYTYTVRFNNSCGLNFTTAGASAADNVGVPPTAANNTAADVSVCADTGVGVTWTTPSAWGDTGGARTIDVLRNGTAVATGLAATATAYTDLTGVNGTSYAYTVRFNNSCGLNFTTAGANAADNVSVAPTGLTNNTAADVSACGDTGVLISWTADPSSWGGTGTQTYDVLRGATVIATGIAYGTTSFTDLTGVNGTSYTYTVRYNNGCQTATTTGAAASDVVSGGVPTGFANNTAADVSACLASGNGVTWAAPSAWNDSGAGTRTYDVLRNGTPLAAGTGLSVATLSFTDATAVVGTAYTYTVRANNGCAFSTTTTPGASATDLAGSVPSAFANNTAADANTCSATGNTVTWAAPTWNDNGSGTRTYDVLRNGTPLAAGTGLSAATVSFTDATAVVSTAYTYTVRANNGCALTTTTTPGASATDMTGAPPAPVQAASAPGNGQVTTNWALVGGATGYQVLRGSLGGPYSNIGPVQSALTVSYLDSGLTNDTQYCYVIQSVSSCGNSVNSNEQCATPSSCVANVRLNDNLEIGLGNWAIAGTWTADTTVFGSTTTSLRAADPNTNPTRNTCRTAATAAAIAIPAGSTGAQLRFWSQSALAADDYGVVEVSTDGGTAWNKLATVNYPGTVATAPTTTCAGTLAAGNAVFAGTSAGTTYVADLSAYASQNTLIRFNMVTGATRSASSFWYVDDVRVTDGNGLVGSMSILNHTKSATDLVQAWGATTGGENYFVYRNPAPNPASWGSPLSVPAASATGWTDAGELASGTSQFYTVTLYNGCGETAK